MAPRLSRFGLIFKYSNEDSFIVNPANYPPRLFHVFLNMRNSIIQILGGNIVGGDILSGAIVDISGVHRQSVSVHTFSLLPS